MSACFQPKNVVVESKAIGASLEVDDAGVVAACAWRMVHDVAFIGPWTCGRVAHGVADSLGTASRGKGHVVVTLALIKPWPLLVVLDMRHLHDVATGGDHVLVEFDAIEIGVAPVHIGLSVIINEHRWVDVVPVFLLPDERLAQRIDKGTVGRVGYQHADAVAMDGTIHIPFAVALHHAFSPGTVVALVPFEVAQ